MQIGIASTENIAQGIVSESEILLLHILPVPRFAFGNPF